LSCDMCQSQDANRYGMGAYCYGCREIIKKRWREETAKSRQAQGSERLHPVLDRPLGGDAKVRLQEEGPAQEVDSELPEMPGSRSIVHEGERP